MFYTREGNFINSICISICCRPKDNSVSLYKRTNLSGFFLKLLMFFLMRKPDPFFLKMFLNHTLGN